MGALLSSPVGSSVTSAMSEPLAVQLLPNVQAAAVGGGLEAAVSVGLQFTGAVDAGVALTSQAGPFVAQQQLSYLHPATTTPMLNSMNGFVQQQQLPGHQMQMLVSQQQELLGYDALASMAEASARLPGSPIQLGASQQQQQRLSLSLQAWQVGTVLPQLQGVVNACGVEVSVAAGQGGLSQLTLVGTAEQLMSAQSLLGPLLQ